MIRFIIQPVLMEWTVNMGHELILKLSLLLLVMMTLDTALTLITWKGLNHHLGLIHDAIYDKTDGTFSRLTDRFWEMRISFIIEKGYVLVVHIQNLNVKLARNELRFFQAFPDIRIHSYEEILRGLRIKERLKKDFESDENVQDCLADDSNKDVLSRKLR